MFSHYLESIEGIASYPLISLLIFFVFFALVIVSVLRMKKDHVENMSQLPLN